MKQFMGSEFLINNTKGAELYTRYAKHQPIYDYHCHLSAKEIAENRKFTNIGELWLEGDHYKWRVMRAAGVPEEKITGKNTSYEEKFRAFAEVLPNFIGNPIYHWAHMELQRYFDIHEPLSATTVDKIWNEANAKLASEDFTARSLIASSNVELIATTEDPADELQWHAKIKQIKDLNTRVVPTFRPDKVVNWNGSGSCEYVAKLGEGENIDISSLDDLLFVLGKRMDYFQNMGCRSADHGLESIPAVRGSYDEVKKIFAKLIEGGMLEPDKIEKYQYFMLHFFACEYSKRGWTMQMHISAMRNNNTKLFKQLGTDCGADSVGEAVDGKSLQQLFDGIELEVGMPKTILFTMNPSAYYILATMAGNFQGGVPGKIQLGPAWWMLDHRDGIIEQLRILANTGGLGFSVGMLTDSRSFLSYARHDYFRRILCSLIGEWVEEGEVPDEAEMLGKIVGGICVENARRFFCM